MRIIRPTILKMADLLLNTIELLLPNDDEGNNESLVHLKTFRGPRVYGYTLTSDSSDRVCNFFGSPVACDQVTVVLGVGSQFHVDTGLSKGTVVHHNFNIEDITQAGLVVVNWLTKGEAP